MIDFYFLPSMQLVLFLITAIVVFAMQSIYVSKRLFRYDAKRQKSFLGEFLLLIYIGTLALVPTQVYGYRPYGVMSLEPIENTLLIFAFIATIIIAISSDTSKKWRAVAIFALLITQPDLSTALKISYHFLWILGVLILFVHSFFIIHDENKRQKQELSSASIQEGLDNLPTGILFCGEDGYIYLTNRKMQSLMLRFFGAELKNGALMWKHLTSCKIENGQCQQMEDDILIRTEDEAWRFARRCFRVKKTNYVEITVIDATENYIALLKLEKEGEILEIETRETSKIAETMEAVQKEREYLRIRSQVHDVLGQQLTAMQRLSQSENITQYNELLSHSQKAIAQIKGQHQKNAQLFYEEIVEYFHKIGLEIQLHPDLPAENSVAFLLLTALREACTNAVRHAGATLVVVTVEHGPEGYRIEIRNNGELPNKPLVEGGGLFGIRTRVEDAGGTFKVEVIPDFSIVITVSSAGLINTSQ